MRSLPAILLAALTALVIAVSAFLTASHFGMRDWPTPPMPDTATRLITPTEAAGRAGDDVSDDDPIVLETNAGAGAGEAPRVERRTRRGASRSPQAARRGNVRRGQRSGRRPGDRRASDRRADDGRQTPEAADDSAAASGPEPATPEPAPAAPATGTGDQAQARPDDTASPSTQPPPTLEPIVPGVPAAGDGNGQGDSPATDQRPGRGRGAIRDLLEELP
jgi:hypothetical protein